ncbi:MAG: inositol monophosphatase family protein, partial [bacterium]
MSSQKEHIELLDIAKNAVQMSAHALLGQAAMAQKSEWQSHHDIKIVGDKLSEKIILEFLIKKSGLPILSEEHGAVESEQLTDLIWIVDPLDGSLNFSRGLPLCCISIGLWQAEKP